MKILFLFGGGNSSIESKDLEDSYLLKISRTEDMEIKTINSKGKTPDEIKNSESTAMLITTKSSDYVIVFDERGKKLSSEKFSDLLNKSELEGKRLVAIVGGAYGVNDELRNRANAIVAFSDMIFPHDLARIMAIEQTYRGLAIRKGSPYHHVN